MAEHKAERGRRCHERRNGKTTDGIGRYVENKSYKNAGESFIPRK